MEDILKYWDVCSDSIRKLCEIRLKSFPDSVDDTCSEIYLAYAEAVKSQKEILYPKAFLYKTANNLITKKFNDLVKEKSNFETYNFSDKEIYVLDISPDISDLIISDDEINKLADEIINECTDEEQKILRLFHKDGKSYKEIADELDKSESAVKQQNYRLSKRIRKRVIEIFSG